MHRSSPTAWPGPIFLAALLSALAACAPEPSTFPGAPVILVSVDTLRADRLPAYGYSGVETPHLDRFRRDAILFENAYTACPLTLPAHASLLSGRLPPAHGVRDNLGYAFDAAAVETIPAALGRAGYSTGAAVSAYVLHGSTGLAAPFDHYDDAVEARSDRSVDRLERAGSETLRAALEWIEGRGEEPFFFFLHLFEPHDPYEPPEPWKSRYADPYDGEIAAVDALLGSFFDHLREKGLYDRAVIVFLSDHGEGLGDHGEPKHGMLLYRETVRVPLMLKLPGSGLGGTAVAVPAQLADVFPTLGELLEVPVPEDLPGTSLLALGGEEAPPRRIYSETLYGRIHYGWSEIFSLSDARFRLIDSPDPELYDLEKDPHERTDVLASQRRTYRAMKDELDSLAAGFEPPAAADPEQAARLAALGYLAAPAPEREGPRPNPRDNLHLLDAVQRGVDLQGAGRHEEAVAELRQLLDEHPEVQDAHLLLAPSLRALGRYDEAIDAGHRALDALPSLTGLISAELARNHLAKGELKQAEAAARLSEASNPAQAHELLARIALARGDLEAALLEAEAARGEGTLPRLAALALEGRIHLMRGEPAAAAERLGEAHTLIAADRARPLPDLAADLGDALARLGRYEEAEAAFEAEIRAFPGNLKGYARLAFLYGAQNRFGEIEPLMRQMVQARPDRGAYLAAAETLERMGNAEGAAAWRAEARRLPEG